MSIPYAGGTNVNNTVALGVGTERVDLIGAINTALVAAGWTSTAVKANSTLTFSANAANNETVTCGLKTYTFKTAINNGNDGEVLVGATTADSITNLVAAIGLGAGSGTLYSTATTANANVEISSSSATTVVVRSKTGGTTNVGQAVSETLGSGSWSPTTLQNGGYDLICVETPGFQQVRSKFLLDDLTTGNLEVTVSNRDATRLSTATNMDINTAQILAGRTFRIIANKYQYFIFVPGLTASAQNGTHTAAGALSIPTFQACKKVSAATNATPIQITTTAAHGYTTGQTVTVAHVGGNTAANGTWVITVVSSTAFTLDTSVGNGTYTSGGVVGNDTLGEVWEAVWGMCNQASSANWRNSMNWNTSGCFLSLNGASFTTTGAGALGPVMTALPVQSSTPYAIRYHNGDYLVQEPWVSAAPTGAGNPRIVGQIWDAIIVVKDYPADTVQTFDSHNWWMITDSGTSFVPGALLIVIP